MKVLFVLHSPQAGGAERHLLQLMQGLTARGIECIYAGLCDSWLGKQLAAAGFECEQIPYRGMFDLYSLASLVRLIRREKPDLIHAHMGRGAFYAGWASRLTGVPNVATAHLMDAGKRFGRAGRIIAVSNAVKGFLIECRYSGDLIRTVHNGVPDYAAAPHLSKEQLRLNLNLDDSPVITMVARFTIIKGQDIALRALAALKDRRWTLLLAGSLDTPWAAEMQDLAEHLGIADRVRFVGHRDDVSNIYACTDILIAPSRREALSLTLLEAAAFRLPIVASRVDGIVEAVADGETGLLVPPSDPEALASGIRVLLDDVELRHQMGAAGRERFEAQFSIEHMVQGALNVYEELIAENNAGMAPLKGACS